jgi:hypothetical protein
MWIDCHGPTLSHAAMDQLHISARDGSEGSDAYGLLVRSICWHSEWDNAMVDSLDGLFVGRPHRIWRHVDPQELPTGPISAMACLTRPRRGPPAPGVGLERYFPLPCNHTLIA